MISSNIIKKSDQNLNEIEEYRCACLKYVFVLENFVFYHKANDQRPKKFQII